jgi:hypothetical protein
MLMAERAMAVCWLISNLVVVGRSARQVAACGRKREQWLCGGGGGGGELLVVVMAVAGGSGGGSDSSGGGSERNTHSLPEFGIDCFQQMGEETAAVAAVSATRTVYQSSASTAFNRWAKRQK